MSIETVELSTVVATLTEATFSPCPIVKRQTMLALEHFQSCDNYVESLVRVIDVNDLGANMKMETRHLAAVLLKNLVGKRGASVDKQCNANAGARPLLITEKTALKAFLARYLYEPECKVALQLSLVVAKLARQEGDSWVKDWPELIPSLVNMIQASTQMGVASPSKNNAVAEVGGSIPTSGHGYVCSIRSIAALHELLNELSGKAACGCSAPSFVKGYANLCAQLYPIISKLWANNMKQLNPITTKLNAHAASYNAQINYSSTMFPSLESITGHTSTEIESLLVHTIVISKVMRIVLEFGFELIGTQYTTFYKTFWRSYLCGIKLLADFIRAHRPMCASILKQRASSQSTQVDVNKRTGSSHVYMKNVLMAEDDADDLCDSYFQIGTEHVTITDTLSALNITLKLIKHLVCGPLVIQRKYPILVVPSLECMVGFYYNTLVEEYPYRAQEYELNSTSNNGTVLSFDQAHSLYTVETLRNALPLNYLCKACILLLSGVLRCAAYDEYNLYTNNICNGSAADAKTTNATACASSSSSTSSNSGDCMVECEAKAPTAGGCDLKKTFFNAERVRTLMSMIIYPMLTFHAKELNEWSEDPEQFIISQQSHEECQSVKNAAQGLYYGLMDHAPSIVCGMLQPLLLDCVRQNNIYAPDNIHTTNNAIVGVYKCTTVSKYVHNRELSIWDSVYMCTGLGICNLSEHFRRLKAESAGEPTVVSNYNVSSNTSVDTTYTTSNNTTVGNTASKNANTTSKDTTCGASYWVQHYLGPMVTSLLQNPLAGCLEHKQQLLRSRLVWLLGIWMHKFDVSVLPHVLQILIDIVGPTGDSDVVVKMYAVEALSKLVNLEIFDITTLVYYVVSAVEALCLMVRNLEESDNKMTVLALSGELIQLLSVQRSSLRPLVVPLAGYLENLWSETGHTDPTRGSILEVMTILVRAAKDLSSTILPVTTPLIMFALQTGSNSSTVSNLNHSATSSGGSSGNYGYLVKDGLALWLAVMQNLTEAQYAMYHKELHQMYGIAMTSLHITHTYPTPTPYSTDAFVYNSWDIFAEPDSSALITDIVLVSEAYCLLSTEQCSILSERNCSSALTALFMKCIGKVDAKIVEFVMRPLQALLISCPTLAGSYLNESGVLPLITRIVMASANCPNFQKILLQYKQSDYAVVSYVTLVAYVMILDPATLFTALTNLVVEILDYVIRQCGTKCDRILDEGIVMNEICGVMFNLFASIKCHTAPLFTSKLWSIALLSLLPPTMINNTTMHPTPSTTNTNDLSMKPDCLISRTMLKLLNSVHCRLGRAKLENYQRDRCSSTNSSNSSNIPDVDYSSLCFWFPSVLNAQQVYYLVEPIVKVCKSVLKDERRKCHSSLMQRQLEELIKGGSSESSSDNNNMNQLNMMLGGCSSTDSSECSVEEDSDSDDFDMKCSGRYEGTSSGGNNNGGDTVNMGGAITAADGDGANLDVCELPLLTVLRSRLTDCYLFNASIEVHLTEKFTQLSRTLGEEQFANLGCIADLNL